MICLGISIDLIPVRLTWLTHIYLFGNPQDLEGKKARIKVAFKLEELKQWIHILSTPQAGVSEAKLSLIIVYT